MALWDKLKTELDRAGRVAQTAIDGGKVRIDLMRVRQLADKTAEALGYAIFNARQQGHEMDPDSFSRLSSTLATHLAEVERLEGQLARADADEADKASQSGASTTGAPVQDTHAPQAGSAGATAPMPAAAPPEPISSVDPAMGDSPDRTTPDAP